MKKIHIIVIRVKKSARPKILLQDGHSFGGGKTFSMLKLKEPPQQNV